MILQNLTIGYGKHLQPLKCGDICKYKVNGDEKRGMIVYDMSDYSFAFEQLDDDFPIISMSKVDKWTIEKIASLSPDIVGFPNYEKWVKIYNSNLGILESE